MCPEVTDWAHKDVVILHDYMQVGGGAERLVTTLARALPEAGFGVSGLYADYLASGLAQERRPEILGHQPGWMPRIPKALLTFSAGRPELRAAHTVLYSGNFTPLAVGNQHSGRRIAYCHTPPRFAYDREDSYLGRVPAAARPVLRLAIARYRRNYERAMRQMDLVLTNSEHVRARIEAQLSLNAEVVYPPIDTALFKWAGQGDFYLSLGRLEPNKRVDRVIEAFRLLPDKKLVVASGGSQLDRMRTLAAGADNIAVLGWQSDAALAELVGKAIACIYVARDEDFGMSPVEAMAAGKPVIGVAEGGLVETIRPGVTGLLLDADPTAQMIAAGVQTLSAETAAGMRTACERQAQGFDQARFLLRMREVMEL